MSKIGSCAHIALHIQGTAPHSGVNSQLYNQHFPTNLPTDFQIVEDVQITQLNGTETGTLNDCTVLSSKQEIVSRFEMKASNET